MRRAFALLTLCAAAGCAPRPPVQPTRAPAQAPVQPAQGRNDLVGMTAAQLVAIFGTPALQVREGPGLKLQFRGRSCVLDAYLYPDPSSERVTYVEARLPSGDPANAQSCYDMLKN